jgi:undecaprenyl-diphosphatase
MNLFESFFLGLLQGLTEFLPVSSSAHLVLAPYFFSFEDPGLAFDVALHMGTLAAIILAFRHDWLAIAISTLHKLRIMPQKKIKTPEFLTLYWLIFGTLPAALCGLFFEKQAEHPV